MHQVPRPHRHPSMSGDCKVPRPHIQCSRRPVGLGEVTDVLHEWWPIAPIRAERKRLRTQKAEFEAEVAAAGIHDYDEGNARKRTKAERGVLRCHERLERLRLLEESFLPGEMDASEVRMHCCTSRCDDPCLKAGKHFKNSGTHRLHFKGPVRCCRVEYARLSMGHGRRYPRNAPSMTHIEDGKEPGSWRMLAVTAQGMPRDLRAACLAHLHDIDICACHPSIFVCLAREHSIEVPTLQRYVEETKAWRKNCAEHHGLVLKDGAPNIDAAKEVFTLLIYGGSYAKRRREWKEWYGVSSKPMKFVEDIATELRMLREKVIVMPKYKPFVEQLTKRYSSKKRRDDLTGKWSLPSADQVQRSVWAMLCQRLEDEALTAIRQAVESVGLVVFALVFDGLMVYHNPRASLDGAMRKAEDLIFQQRGLQLKLVEKPLYDRERVATYAL